VSLSSLPISRAFDYSVRRTTVDDIPALGYALAAAFYDDPVMSWIIPDDERRRERLPSLMELFAGRFQPHGENRINEAGTGAAIWCPPGATFSADDDARLEADLVAVARDDLARTGEVVELLDGSHPADEEHYYLMLLGVIPDRQGAGIGSALLRAVLDNADRDGVPAYLEATSPRNRDLYERHGFTVTRELRTSDCPPLWGMWRRPRP
jgi:GNAT superfamily N-acetyltransferase